MKYSCVRVGWEIECLDGLDLTSAVDSPPLRTRSRERQNNNPRFRYVIKSRGEIIGIASLRHAMAWRADVRKISCSRIPVIDSQTANVANLDELDIVFIRLRGGNPQLSRLSCGFTRSCRRFIVITPSQSLPLGVSHRWHRAEI